MAPEQDNSVARDLHIKPGVERWSVKTGVDAHASEVNTTPIQAYIAELIALPAPANPDEDLGENRDTPVELTTYELECTLIAYKEEADGDYHLVLSDANNITMIAEIPDPDFCEGSVWMQQIKQARQTFDNKFGEALDKLAELTMSLAEATSSEEAGVAMITHVSVPVIVVGVGFFDMLHGQTGVAPNGIELHPVLSITFT